MILRVTGRLLILRLIMYSLMLKMREDFVNLDQIIQNSLLSDLKRALKTRMLSISEPYLNIWGKNRWSMKKLANVWSWEKSPIRKLLNLDSGHKRGLITF